LTELPNAARHLGATLNWRRDPAAEQRRIELEQRAIWLDKQHALLDWIESEIDLIEADLPAQSAC
jgi:hypothetical protein